MLDLLKTAKTESNGGDLKKCLSDLYTETDVRPKGYDNALVGKVVNIMVKLTPYAILLLMLMPC